MTNPSEEPGCVTAFLSPPDHQVTQCRLRQAAGQVEKSYFAGDKEREYWAIIEYKKYTNIKKLMSLW